MASFQDLGLRDELLRALEDADLETPTGFQAAAIPVLRRGGNLVARATAGAGKALAYGLGIFDRLEPTEPAEDDGVPTRVLLLFPTREEAERTALSLIPFAQAVGLSVTVYGESWATPAGQAEVLTATPAGVLEAVRGSALKLDAVEAAVIDGAAAIQELGDIEALETLLDHLPRDAQRVLLSSAMTDEIEDLIDRRVKRALRYPSEPAIRDEQPQELEGKIGYIIVPEQQKLDLLARALSGRTPGENPPVLFCRTDERAATIAEALAIRGFLVGDAGDPESDVAIVTAGVTREELAQDSGEAPAQTISYDVPADENLLLGRHQGDADAIVFIEPREFAHLREIARRTRLRVYAAPVPTGGGATARELTRFRAEIRQALETEDVSAQMLVLEPLFEEFSAAEIAAAAAALLRRKRAAEPSPPAPTAGAASRPATAATSGSASVPAARAEAGPPPATFARLFVGIGNRDGVRPGDLVGAIAGETNIPGSRVGRIDIRDNFSIVEIQAEVADQVIRALNGTTMKGRSLRVDYDRGGDRGRKPAAGARPAAGTRRTPVRRPRPE